MFPAEIAEIAARRERLGAEPLTSEAAEGKPSTDLKLVGLAISGGGIRSATFALGVIQTLAREDVLKTVDYMSTVSGGGYIGSCLSSLLNNGAAASTGRDFPLSKKTGEAEPAMLSHLRNARNYLAPGGLLDALRIPAVVLRGILNNFAIFLLLILLLLPLTEVCYKLSVHSGSWLGTLVLGVPALFLVLVLSFPFFAQVLKRKSNWRMRDRSEKMFASALLILFVVLLLVPLGLIVELAIQATWSDAWAGIVADLRRPLQSTDIYKWLAVAVVLSLLMLTGRLSKNTDKRGKKIFVFLIGVLGPAFLFSVYLALVMLGVDSVFIAPKTLFTVSADKVWAASKPTVTPALREEFDRYRVPLSDAAEMINLEPRRRRVIRDRGRAFSLTLDPVRSEVRVSEDPGYMLAHGSVPREFAAAMQSKGHILSKHPRVRRKAYAASSAAAAGEQHYLITGRHRYGIREGLSPGLSTCSMTPREQDWTLVQVVNPAVAVQALHMASSQLDRYAHSPVHTLIHESVSLSTDSTDAAVHYVNSGNTHDVVLVLDKAHSDLVIQATANAYADKPGPLSPRPLDSARIAVVRYGGSSAQRSLDVTRFSAFNPENVKSLLEQGNALLEQADYPKACEADASDLTAAVRCANALRGRSGSRRSLITVGGPDEAANPGGRSQVRAIAATAASLESGLSDLISRIEDASPAYEPFCLAGKDGKHLFALYRSGRFVRIEAAVPSPLNVPFPSLADRIAIDETQRAFLERNGVNLPTNKVTIELASRENSARISEDPCADPRSSEPWATCWRMSDPYAYEISPVGDRFRVLPPAHSSWLDGLGRSSIARDGHLNFPYIAAVIFLLLYWYIFDVNATSVHRFYRDRLSVAYLVRPRNAGTDADNDLNRMDRQKLSELNAEGTVAPYHLINVALNLEGSMARELRGRNADFFVFSKHFVGSPRMGFVATRNMEVCDGHLDLGTAMAISGAAAAPNMGTETLKPLVFILTLLNIRLGYWLPNPRFVPRDAVLPRAPLRFLLGPGPGYLLREALGRLHERTPYINVSDGGHLENLGIYELLRRRCKYIIAIDGEADPALRFPSLMKLLRYARIDLGITIEFEHLDEIHCDAPGTDNSAHWAIGRIYYGDDDVGYLLYIKSSFSGDEPDYVRDYRERNPDFPHESTADQFFSEEQFEAYRALGEHIGERLFSNRENLGEFANLQPR